MELTTKRLLLRPFNGDDKQAFFAYRSDAKANKYQGWIPKTLDDVETFFVKLAAEFNVPDTWFQLAVLDKTNDELIGDMGIHFIDEQQVELGYTIAKQHQGKGFATEAVKAVIDHLFHDLKKRRITASIDPENVASFALLEKLGFRKEAHFVESLFLNDKWVDDVIYALLAREWK
ncbi:GNAT family protein [Draconibacterium sp. IB214405]|uniref:GNAT family N-acetyltransferase n=1 Tax=Draconibacterium sp. IB214405 TaxID=3097352 RepID=UPI002A0AFE78|nr:GNAT family protein [Draconibacterium sp. IB214405]MDX8340959.1 GNAT family protein [Draconibacterium sp. IB214405]